MLADALADREAIHARQHHIQQDQIIVTAEPHAQPFEPVLRKRGGKAMVGEHIDQTGANRNLVLDDQDACLLRHVASKSSWTLL